MGSSREIIKSALDHKEPDHIPMDFGGSGLTGMHVSTVYRLRQKLGLDPAGTPVKVIEPYQMLGEIQTDLFKAFGIDTDVVALEGKRTLFGFNKVGWKPWTTFDKTPVLVPEGFNTEPEPNGDILLYPENDRSAPPSGRMPKDGMYFDTIVRQAPIDENKLKVEDNLEEFKQISDEDIEYLAREADRLFRETDKAILASFGSDTDFGDIAMVPAPWLKYPKGIRDIEEWYVSLSTRQPYVYEIFTRQCEIALANLEKISRAVGDRVTAIVITGADFGMQTGPLISPKTYRKLFQPFHKIVNDWIHNHTSWKTFIHSCGSVSDLIEDFIAAGFDILNPVQCSAARMDPKTLKQRFGSRITFWGAGIDTQHTLPFGTPEEVRREVRERIETFGIGGGFVFSSIHNIQANVPMDNIIAMFETIAEYYS